MKKATLDRILLLVTGLLASYQIVVGINNLGAMPIAAYTIGFGVLLLASLLLIILSLEALNSPVVAVISSIIPLSLSLGLMWEHGSTYGQAYMLFAMLGFLAIAASRAVPFPGSIPTIVLAVVHGVAGMIIFLMPMVYVARGLARPAFALVGVGGALIGLGGLLLTFMKAGSVIPAGKKILQWFPVLLLLTTAAFVAGFMFG
jgi:hypothetical protein